MADTKSPIDKVYEIVTKLDDGVELPEVKVGLADSTIYKIVGGIAFLFGIMTALVFFLVRAQRKS
jgi:hypothetical protein